MAVVDGAIWEVLSYVPGRALMWDPAVPVESAGALLARFHQASLAISPDDQRPGALPLDNCHPVSAKLIADRFHPDLPDALWVTGRSEQPEVSLDYARVRAFVAGYHAVRPLPARAIKAIPLYLVGRGLQMLVRGERLHGPDQKVLERLRWLHEHRNQLEDVVASSVVGAAS